jgi:chromosome segregation ATPase
MALNLAALNLPTPPRAPVAATAASPAPEVSDEGGRYEGTPTGDRGARTRLAQAEAELGRLVREVADAVTRLGEAEQRALAARSDVSSLEERLGIARQRAEDRGREEEGARSRLAELRRALQAAEAERDRARALIG